MKPDRLFAIFSVCSVSIFLAVSTTVLGQNPAVTKGELRQYEVLVKNKSVGSVSIHISQTADDITTASTETSVVAQFLWIKYHYEFHGKEIWHGDRLVQMDSRANDNGTPLIACAIADARTSRIDVQGKASQTGPVLAMTTNYWRLPTAICLGGTRFSIIEPDTGIIRVVRLERVGMESVTVDGRDVACTHYRLSGEVAAELWYDAQDRLVRQQTVEQGYLTEQRLRRIVQNM